MAQPADRHSHRAARRRSTEPVLLPPGFVGLDVANHRAAVSALARLFTHYVSENDAGHLEAADAENDERDETGGAVSADLD